MTSAEEVGRGLEGWEGFWSFYFSKPLLYYFGSVLGLHYSELGLRLQQQFKYPFTFCSLCYAGLVCPVCAHSSHVLCGFSHRIKVSFFPDLFSWISLSLSRPHERLFPFPLARRMEGSSWHFSYRAAALQRLHDWGLSLNQRHMVGDGSSTHPLAPRDPFLQSFCPEGVVSQHLNCLCC